MNTQLRPLAGIALALGLALPVSALTPAQFIEGARDANLDVSIDRETEIIRIRSVHFIFSGRNERPLSSADSQHPIEGVVAYTFIDVEMPDDEVIERLSLELRKKYGVILTQIDGKLAVATCERGLEGQKDIDVLRKINLCVERIHKAVSMADDD